MLRRILDFQLSLTEKGKPLHFLRPLVDATDTFLYEAEVNTSKGPHIRDAIDIKRWMVLVIVSLIPCILMAIWNTGLQAYVYSSGNYHLMNEYLSASSSWEGYFNFAAKDGRYLSFIAEGLNIFIPLAIVSYAVGTFWEYLFAYLRGHEISEGLLVTGILYVLIMPPTIPLWMAAFGISAGIIFAKEVFGGSGMNIVNPALSCRAFLFFTFPGRMSGDVWVGSNPTTVRNSLVKMNQEAQTSGIDSYSQATALNRFNVTQEIKNIHVDAIATNYTASDISSMRVINEQFDQWKEASSSDAILGKLSTEQLQSFVTTPLGEGGLGLSPGYYEDAYRFASLKFGMGHNSDIGFFFGDKLGCLGETSTFACLLGALFLIYTGIASWRTIVGMGLGAFLTAYIFQFTSNFIAADHGAFLPAQFGFPAYKHLILGGLAFGMVFMATDPVSSPSIKIGQWIYGLLCGLITIIIRVINPAYPEGVMLAILVGNVFAPLIDYYTAYFLRKRSLSSVRKTS
jgi:Na+-transporting NADH:ubiquinone oxidoreductase subunit B